MRVLSVNSIVPSPLQFSTLWARSLLEAGPSFYSCKAEHKLGNHLRGINRAVSGVQLPASGAFSGRLRPPRISYESLFPTLHMPSYFWGRGARGVQTRLLDPQTTRCFVSHIVHNLRQPPCDEGHVVIVSLASGSAQGWRRQRQVEHHHVELRSTPRGERGTSEGSGVSQGHRIANTLNVLIASLSAPARACSSLRHRGEGTSKGIAA